MKKIISLALALVMLLTVAMPVFAATDPYSKNVVIDTSTLKDTDGDGVGDESAEDYILTIPANTTIAWGTESTDVSYTVETHLARNKYVEVIVSGNGEMKTADGVYALAYALEGEGIAFTADAPVIYPAATKEVKVVVAADDWNKAVVEAYSDTLTFAAEVKTA